MVCRKILTWFGWSLDDGPVPYFRSYHHQSSLRAWGTLGQCSVRSLRALKNVVGCGCVLDTLLFITASEDREQKTFFLLHLKAYGTLHTIMLHNLCAHPEGTLVHGLSHLCTYKFPLLYELNNIRTSRYMLFAKIIYIYSIFINNLLFRILCWFMMGTGIRNALAFITMHSMALTPHPHSFTNLWFLCWQGCFSYEWRWQKCETDNSFFLVLMLSPQGFLPASYMPSW